MLSPNEREKSAIHAIAGSNEGQIFRDYLLRNLSSMDEANRQKEGPEMYRGQGGAIEIDELIKLVI